MANQEQQRQSQGNMMMRRGVNPTGLLLAPGDLFRMNPFSLMRRMGPRKWTACLESSA